MADPNVCSRLLSGFLLVATVLGAINGNPMTAAIPKSASKNQRVVNPTFRFAGHQTFALRLAWLPKAAMAIASGKDPLTDIDEGITTLGLGKNMVEALRCWIEAFQIADREQGRWKLTPVGELVFDPRRGLDRYLEDVSTSWLLHWLISTNATSPFFAWECMFNRWPSTEFCASQVLQAFQTESSRSAKPQSPVTLRQHWEVFIHSYRPLQSRKGEDHLDSAMSVLRLIRDGIERPNASGKLEMMYGFDTGRKSAIPQQLFSFFLNDWWNRHYPNDDTAPLGEAILGEHSPGRILKMQEPEIVQRIAELEATSPHVLRIIESTNLRKLHRQRPADGLADLRSAYESPRFIRQ